MFFLPLLFSHCRLSVFFTTSLRFKPVAATDGRFRWTRQNHMGNTVQPVVVYKLNYVWTDLLERSHFVVNSITMVRPRTAVHVAITWSDGRREGTGGWGRPGKECRGVLGVGGGDPLNPGNSLVLFFLLQVLWLYNYVRKVSVALGRCWVVLHCIWTTTSIWFTTTKNGTQNMH